jgi:SWIM zinc finger
MTTLAGSITKDGNTWRLQGRDGAVYVWRVSNGRLSCSCGTFRQGKNRKCRHVLAVIQYLTAALQAYAKDGDSGEG